MTRLLHDLVSNLLAADFEVTDCLENDSTIFVYLEDVEDLRRLVRLATSDVATPAHWSARVSVRVDALPLLLAMPRSDARLVLRAIAAYVQMLDRWDADAEERAAARTATDLEATAQLPAPRGPIGLVDEDG
jgi:hypothetical protein